MVQLAAMLLLPEYRPRVWGGRRLKAADPPIGEAWICYEGSELGGGAQAGATLQELAARFGPALTGRRAPHGGKRFPILLKLLDTADWLSIQVHPNDAQARRLEGREAIGKTEAWHVLDAGAEARLIAGLRPGSSRGALRRALANGGLLPLLCERAVTPGDTLLIPAGTVHAPGPGLLLYEVQQMSDITYRLWDWDRPQTAGRALHLDQALSVVDAAADPPLRHAGPPAEGYTPLTGCPYFTLTLLRAERQPLRLAPDGETFHALTLTAGAAELHGAGWSLPLAPYETAVVPAECPDYAFIPASGGCTALLAALP
ncbi:MAG TPA: type I phosphomannose isomerase catalytic subunit [Dehalococcoidia bacterium]|nr:type I phosphomannose isomerase catalytic subunit [Dehalococcoidia bacterium]